MITFVILLLVVFVLILLLRAGNYVSRRRNIFNLQQIKDGGRRMEKRKYRHKKGRR
ncbi:MAG: hypothetical protein U9R57_17705 [Thermodesulfobacteriota bacterium]|nr:hypothetical protein [Thermodesulfobacteriota bacterium]